MNEKNAEILLHYLNSKQGNQDSSGNQQNVIQGQRHTQQRT